LTTRAREPVRILGIDPGTRKLGYGIVDLASGGASERGIAYVECGVIAAPTEGLMSERLGVVCEALAEVITEFSPTVIALELAFTGKNAASALKLGLARGAVMLLAAQNGVPVLEYAPAKVKRVVVGHGRATKEDVQRRVRLLCRLRRDPMADAADALAIALCHAHMSPAGRGAVLHAVRRAVPS
jgi:crossover junction endodeoxyribonuclease RuvC